ncbi:hypothetical protein HW555_009975 [Spodoptera exigua]|uniref:Uncharacterized protein n=1 Tax=Spodoptera exigua TaxID=7107 RepID=A0A835L1Y3_SPOEX|nr:hypothetical protein HW555_009975 [Spodoptera exigua]
MLSSLPYTSYTVTKTASTNDITQATVIIAFKRNFTQIRKLQNIINTKEHIIKEQRLQIKRIQAQNRRLKRNY